MSDVESFGCTSRKASHFFSVTAAMWASECWHSAWDQGRRGERPRDIAWANYSRARAVVVHDRAMAILEKERAVKQEQIERIRDAIKVLQTAINEADSISDIWLQVERGHIGIDMVGQNVDGFVVKARIIQETVVT